MENDNKSGSGDGGNALAVEMRGDDPMYESGTNGEMPSDAELLAMGYAEGDFKFKTPEGVLVPGWRVYRSSTAVDTIRDGVKFTDARNGEVVLGDLVGRIGYDG